MNSHSCLARILVACLLAGAAVTSQAAETQDSVAGDDLDRPLVLTESFGVAHANNLKATRQAGEPLVNSYAVPATVWWSWTPPADGVATFSTAGSSFDTALAVFLRLAVDRFAEMAINDEDPAAAPASRTKVQVRADQTYLIMVGSAVAGETGDIALQFELRPPQAPVPSESPPANDAFASRIELTSPNLKVTGSNAGASAEAGEIVHPAFGTKPKNSVWWKWTAPDHGWVTFTTEGSSFDTVVFAYEDAATVGALTMITGNDDAAFGQRHSTGAFPVVASRTYAFSVDGVAGETGSISLGLSFIPGPPETSPPLNDNFANATVIDGAAARMQLQNRGATVEPGEPSHGTGALGRSVWWRWTAMQSGSVYLSARARTNLQPSHVDLSSVNAVVYEGENLTTLKTVGRANKTTEALWRLVSVLRFDAEAGHAYHIAVDSTRSRSETMELVLNAQLPAPRLGLAWTHSEPGGAPSLRVVSSYPRNVQILTSPNLVDWALWQTVAVPDELSVTLPVQIDAALRQFYRLSTWE